MKHQLEYSIWSAKVSWCSICNKHFYNERNEKHTTLATEEHYHFTEDESNPLDAVVMPLLIKDNILGKLIDRLNQFERQLNSGYGMMNKQKIQIRIRELKKIISLVKTA